MPTLNLGIVAHVDAGKTTLTERLLFETGASAHIGRVDHGDTITDTDALERQRGITIRSAVVTFRVDDVTVNLIDTPGHSDFVAEVERALGVLGGAVLVVSAVEGVQAQTRVLIRILERQGIPFLVFVNKIDRVGATYTDTMVAVREALTGGAVALNRPRDLGSRAATVSPPVGDERDETLETVAEYDEALLARYVDGTPPTYDDVLATLARLTSEGRLHPVLFGAALTGTGVADIIGGLTRFLPTKVEDDQGPLHGTVFKIERGPAGHKVAFVRMHAGTLSGRDPVTCFRRSPTGAVTEVQGRATNVSTFSHGTTCVTRPAHAGEIAKVVGVSQIAIGDQLGRWDPTKSGRYFAPPGLEAVVRASDPTDRPGLFQALRQLAAQDPLIDARLDGPDLEATVSLYGEVQKEVLAARLATEFGIVAEFLPTQTVYVERVSGVGEAVTLIGAPGNPDLATVGLRIAPGPVDSGIEYRREVHLGGLLLSFHTAIEETVPAALQSGLYGWPVTDCVVTLTRTGYAAPVSSAGDFRRLTAIVLRQALDRAGTTVCAPVSEFEVEIPAVAMSQVLQRLVAAGATPQEPVLDASRCRLAGVMPTDQVNAFEQRLPALTQGEGFFFSRPAGFRETVGPPPARRILRHD